jgi:type I restriction-modification system DNA methylase subunit
MALKKSELYSSLWSSCDELRGGMDASQYKDYVLVLLFIKYVSDKYAGLPVRADYHPDWRQASETWSRSKARATSGSDQQEDRLPAGQGQQALRHAGL